jgi:hypothetical protein
MPVMVSVVVMALMPSGVRADGAFVTPKFVWDKHKDINEPTQKAIIVYDAGREDLILQVKYEGPVDQFGWLIPVPNLPTVRLGSMNCFYELSKFIQKEQYEHSAIPGVATLGASDNAAGQSTEPPVTVVETKTVGAYETAVLSAKDSGSLTRWLDDNHFYIPPDKTDVIDSYIKEHYYFVAVKIDLSKWFPGLSSTPGKLASGELNPLQLSFASDRCVFPLKISSINGKPSEVSLYVLAADPLLCQAQFERDRLMTYSNDMAHAEAEAQRMKNGYIQTHAQENEYRKQRGLPPVPPHPDDENETVQRIRETPWVEPDEELQFTRAASSDLRDCRKIVPRLTGKSWWIATKTWTFQPADMQDLDFGPALPVLAETLGSKYGYIAITDLLNIGPHSVPTLITAVNSPSPMARADAAKALNAFRDDPRVKAAAPGWLKNSEPHVRAMAVYTLGNFPEGKPEHIERFIPLLYDEDADVRDTAVLVMTQDRENLPKYLPLFRKMLADTNQTVRVIGLRLTVMAGAGATIDRSEWLSFLSSPDRTALGIVATHFRWSTEQDRLSDDEAVPLLHNPEPLGRLIGLAALSQNGDAHAIELARPFLNDTNATVRFIAARDIKFMTGQDPPGGR